MGPKLAKLTSGRDAHIEKDLFSSVRGFDEKLHLLLRPPAGGGVGEHHRHFLSREVDESD